MLQVRQDHVVPVARALLSAVYLMSGTAKIVDFNGAVAEFTALGLPMPPAAVLLTIVVWLGGGLSVLLGYKARAGAALLIVYTVAATLIAHAFWNFTGEAQHQHLNGFFLNIAVMGGLLMVVAYGPGPRSLDPA